MDWPFIQREFASAHFISSALCLSFIFLWLFLSLAQPALSPALSVSARRKDVAHLASCAFLRSCV